jgi:phenylpropionate dioxygenase-like ring-hydroxylating dioxygenase large terminal subunit
MPGMNANTLFNAESYLALRKPLRQASGLPPGCYTDTEFYRREREQVFQQHWQFVGRAEQLAEVGSYFCFDGPGGPVIVLRSATDELKAFANSCRHRGARLLDGCGSSKRIVCPYHSWSYRLDGRLSGAPGMQDSIDFDAADFPLLELPLSCWAGFIFIHYQPDPAPLTEQLGDFCDRFSDHACADMRLVGELDFDIAANWKLLAENSLEAYHTGSVHRETLGQQQSCSIDDIRGRWTGLLVEDEHSVATLPGEDNPFPYIDGLNKEALSGAYFTLLYPSTQFVFAQDCMWWLAFLPISVERTRLSIGACFPQKTIALEGFGDKVKPYFERWQQATVEDNAICEQQQLGQAVARPPGRYAGSEFAVHAFDNWVIDQVLAR